jgi:stearoyl-CoA desaturase (delta-9 desaturase)
LDGWTGVIFAGYLRIFITCHLTWSVNSICHRYGQRSYDTPDQSRNNFWIALFTFGEGWHNNHHRYLQMPYFGHKWYQIDIGKWVLQLCKPLGLVWDLKIPSELKKS